MYFRRIVWLAWTGPQIKICHQRLEHWKCLQQTFNIRVEYLVVEMGFILGFIFERDSKFKSFGFRVSNFFPFNGGRFWLLCIKVCLHQRFSSSKMSKIVAKDEKGSYKFFWCWYQKNIIISIFWKSVTYSHIPVDILGIVAKRHCKWTFGWRIIFCVFVSQFLLLDRPWQNNNRDNPQLKLSQIQQSHQSI